MKLFTATIIGAVALAFPLWSGIAGAQTLLDPTRPPATLAQGSAAAQPGTPAAPRLQSVLISRRDGGRYVAVIDGETVRLGEHYKGARVARMTETEVELVRGAKRQVLLLDMPSLPARTQARSTVQHAN